MAAAGPSAGARDRMVRVMSFAVGAAGSLFLLIATPPVAAQLDLAAPWWNALALTTLVAPAALLAVCAFLAPLRWLRVLAGVLVVGQAVVQALVPAGFARAVFQPDIEFAWPLAMTAAVLCGAPLALGRRLLLPFAAVAAAAHAGALWWVTADADAVWLLRLALGVPFFGMVLAAITVMSLRGGEVLDRDTATLRAEAAARAQVEATAVERARLDALIHDTVLSALLAGGRGGAADTVRAAATQGLSVLDHLAAADTTAAPVPLGEFLARLRQLCSDLDESAVFSTDRDTPDAAVSSATAHGMLEVAGEALRNSLRHAGPGAARTVRVGATTRAVTVVVADNGVGFDPAHVPPHRLGIAIGMRERASQLDRSNLRIESAPGAGAVIRFTAPLETSLRCDRAGGTRRSGPAPAATTAPHLVGLTSTGAALFAAAYLLVEALRPFEQVQPGVFGLPFVLALLVLVVGAVVVLAPSPDPLPRGRAAAVAACAVGAAALNVLPLGAGVEYLPGVLWAWSPATMLLALVCVRGRPLTAWAGAAAVSGAYLLWRGQPTVEFAGDVGFSTVWQALLLTVWTLFATAIRKQVRRINTTRERLVGLAAERAEAQARLDARDEQLSYLDAVARPLLERMVVEGTLDPAGQRDARLVEARLRDRIRARALATEEVLDAAQAARRRGVEVVMLDDGALDRADEELRGRVSAAVVDGLRASEQGRITVRVLPPGRPTVCTIVHADENRYRRAEITAGPEPAAAVRVS